MKNELLEAAKKRDLEEQRIEEEYVRNLERITRWNRQYMECRRREFGSNMNVMKFPHYRRQRVKGRQCMPEAIA